MIVGLLTLLLLGGGSTYLLETIDFYHDRAKDVLPSGERWEQAKDIFDAMEDSTDKRHDTIKDVSKQLADLLEDRDVADAGLDAALAKYSDGIQTYYAEMLDHRSDLKKVVTREEWQQIFSEGPASDG